MARKTPKQAVKKAAKRRAKPKAKRSIQQSLKKARAGTAAKVKGPKQRKAADSKAEAGALPQWTQIGRAHV